jgi:hypothetical protein
MFMRAAVQSQLRRLAVGVIGGAIALTVLASPAHAEFRIESFGGSAIDGSGARSAQAGAHPDITTIIELSSSIGPDGTPIADGNLRTVKVDLPPGLIGNPAATPTCSPVDLATPGSGPQCAPEAQVGIVTIDAPIGTEMTGRENQPIYNVRAPRGLPARLAFQVYGVVVNLDPTIRTGSDYGVATTSRDSSQSLPVVRATVTLWGLPADPRHDAKRWLPNDVGGDLGAPSSGELVPFITAPTECSGAALETRLMVNTWQDATPKFAAFTSDFDGFPFVNEGCGGLGFTPTSDLQPTTSAPDAPTGLNVNLTSPQNLENPNGLASAHLRDVTVTLPEGLTINPGSADGLQACTDEQLGLDNDKPVRCPDAAKVGSATGVTPLLADPIEGSVYVRSQNSGDPQSGEMFRVALVLHSEERGVLVKLAGALKVNPDSGRIVAEFKDNPQLPVQEVKLAFKSGPRAPLATPASCGSKTIAIGLTSWARHNVELSDSFNTDCTPGLGGFAPSFRAGVDNPTAGAFGSFVLAIAKPDGNAPLAGLSMVLPAGLVAQLKGNLNTQVGTVKAFAGPGTNPFVLPGKVFLEGPYGDAPFSLRVVVPAKAGPFDLGEVVVRQKIYVDPITAQVTVVSDPLPTIVKGVPARLQRLEVSVDKPSFIINPTSCAAKTISGTLSAVDGQSVPVTNRFQVGDCASLELKPELALALSGKGQTTDGKHPAVTANLSQSAGQANLRKVRVALPLSLALDPDNANGLCEFVDGSKATPTCPKASIVGSATAVTPILDEPLSGPVYFVKNIRKDPKSGREIRTLPKLVIPLTGQNGLKLTLTGTSDAEDDQLVTTFDNIPDAPVSSFKLNINGGKGGILTVSGADICKSTQIADQQVDGQNNKQADANVYIQTPSCPLKVLSKKVTKRSVTIKVGGLGAGKVTVTGKGIKKTSKSISKSTVATIVVRRTKGAPKQIKVSFLAKGAKKAKTATA